MIPEWMSNATAGPPASRPAWHRGAGTRFIDHSLRELRGALNTEIQTEYYARIPGFLQGIDPRAKLVSALLFILAASLIHRIEFLMLMWLVLVLLMKASRLPVMKIQAVVWFSIPLITLLVSIPGALNIFVPGTPLITLYNSGQNSIELIGFTLPGEIWISRSGCLAAVRLAMRTGLSICSAVLLTMTTPAGQVFRSLSVLKVPAYFIMILEMSCRYLAVLVAVSIEMFEARKARTVGFLGSGQRRTQFGSSLAALFMRSMALTEEIFQSMTARGYTGEVVASTMPPMRWRDWSLIFISVILVAMLYTGGFIFDQGSVFF